MKNSLYSMCVFFPTFVSIIRGEGNKQKKACITTEYEMPTKENWLSLCVGRRNEPANKFWAVDNDYDEDLTYTQYVYKLYCGTNKSCNDKGWWKREKIIFKINQILKILKFMLTTKFSFYFHFTLLIRFRSFYIHVLTCFR